LINERAIYKLINFETFPWPSLNYKVFLKMVNSKVRPGIDSQNFVGPPWPVDRRLELLSWQGI
jgi:hypothetical protein